MPCSCLITDTIFENSNLNVVRLCHGVIDVKLSITPRKGLSTNNKNRKDEWIGHILHGNCFLHVTEGKIEEMIEVMGRWGRRSKLLPDLKETGGHWKLKEDALADTVWWTYFGRGYGPAVRQTTIWLTVHYKFIFENFLKMATPWPGLLIRLFKFLFLLSSVNFYFTWFIEVHLPACRPTSAEVVRTAYILFWACLH